MRPASLTALLALALLVPTAARANVQPEDPGPYAATSEVDTVQAGPSQVQATVCLPGSSGPHPTLALATNLAEGRGVLQGLCLHLATWGFVAAVPDLGFTNTDAASIGSTLLDTLAFLDREGARDGSRFQGLVDSQHRGVIGFNTGAMGALWAAGQDDTLSAAILLDPQDLNGQGRAAATAVVHVPVLIVNGSADPATRGEQGPRALEAHYRKAGLKDVTLCLYPDARHEVLNDSCRDEVTRDLLQWLELRSGSK